MQVKFDNVNLFFNYKNPLQVHALKDINFVLDKSNFIAIIGKTGSGKSTLVDLINVFLKPDSGFVQIEDFINSKDKKIDQKKLFFLRKKIGMLFQISDNQFFEETVLKDVMFGIKNFYPEKDAERLSKEALKLVGLDESFYNHSPFELSGGEKKKLALAGILVYEPSLIILDEITSGLDVFSKNEIIELIRKIQIVKKNKIILISHDIEVIFKYADDVILMNDGKIEFRGNPTEFLQIKDIEKFGIEFPDIINFINLLKKYGCKIDKNIFSIEELIYEIKKNKK